MPLYRLLYRSEISLPDTQPLDQQIQSIVAAADRANALNDLSGALIAADGVFIQALEGPLAALEATFEKICTDLRHKHVRLIELAAADERVFAEWRMVRVEHEDDVLRLCAGFGLENTVRPDVSKTSAIITLMRSILASKSHLADGAGFASAHV